MVALEADRVRHLEFIQTVIGRMGNVSILIKGWSLTVAAGCFAVSANRLSWELPASLLIPISAFWFLDGYYLRQERLFRHLYDAARTPGGEVELWSMNLAPYLQRKSLARATFSITLVPFYGALTIVDIGFIALGLLNHP